MFGDNVIIRTFLPPYDPSDWHKKKLLVKMKEGKLRIKIFTVYLSASCQHLDAAVVYMTRSYGEKN